MPIPGIAEYRAQDYSAALPRLIESAHTGVAEAQCMLGSIYQLGLGDNEIDELAAIQWYYQAASQGYSVATRNLAGMVWPLSSEAAAALNQLAQQQASVGHASARRTSAHSA
ncbi:MAG: hypothetical protein WBD47_14305 [Phormidesmis sp.]